MSVATVGFLSDYGLRDEFVGVCHGVIAERCSDARVIDITHGIAPQDVRGGALALAAALPYLPAGVALAVVDPGVGGGRTALALRTREQGRLLVGPDNGLLIPAAERFGGVAEAFDVGASRVRLQPVSATFHGRDIFAPVAAALAAGEELASLGEPLPPEWLRGLALPAASLRDELLEAHVLYRDGFGNVGLDASAGQLAALGVSPGEELVVSLGGEGGASGGGGHRARYAATFAEVPAGALLVYEDARGSLAVAINEGSAAELLGVGDGDTVLLGLGTG